MGNLLDLVNRVFASSLASLGLSDGGEAIPATEAPSLSSTPVKEAHWSPERDLSRKLLLKLNTATGEFETVFHRSHRSHSSHRSHYSGRSAPSPPPRSTPPSYTPPRSNSPSSQPSYATPYRLGSRTLRVGSVGTDVADLIRRLNAHGHMSRASVGTTEVYTSEVESAVRSFQRARSLGVTGTADLETIRLLQQSPPPPNPEYQLGSRVLSLGSEGADVSELIRLLRERGLLPAGSQQTTYTQVVRSAVRTFQRQEGLVADGVAGPETITLLKATDSSRDTTKTGSETGIGRLEGKEDDENGSSPLDKEVPVALALGIGAYYLYRKSRGDESGGT